MKEPHLYVARLPVTITDDKLRMLFMKFGTIVNVKIPRDPFTGFPRGIAFVNFLKNEEAEAAIQEMHGKMIEGSYRPLTVRVSNSAQGDAKVAPKEKKEEKVAPKEQKALLSFIPPELKIIQNVIETNAAHNDKTLIYEVYCRRPLWDCTLLSTERTEYKIDNLWRELVIGLGLTLYQLKYAADRWKTLREEYILAFKVVNTYVPRFLFDAPPIPSFPYYDQMRFLDTTLVFCLANSHVNCGAPTVRAIELAAVQMPKIVKRSLGDLNIDNSEAKKIKTEDGKGDDIDDFCALVAEGLRSLPLKNRTQLQIMILQLLDDEQAAVLK